MTEQPGGLTLRLRRVFPSAPPLVFLAFSAERELATWWGPAGFSVPTLDFKPRVGDRFRIEMQPPEGDRFYLTGEFREVDPPHRLAYTFVWEAPIPTTSRRWSSCPFETSVRRRRSSSLGLRSRPRRAASSTRTAGRRDWTSWRKPSRRRDQVGHDQLSRRRGSSALCRTRQGLHRPQKRRRGQDRRDAIRCHMRHLARRVWPLLEPPTLDKTTPSTS